MVRENAPLQVTLLQTDTRQHWKTEASIESSRLDVRSRETTSMVRFSHKHTCPTKYSCVRFFDLKTSTVHKFQIALVNSFMYAAA